MHRVGARPAEALEIAVAVDGHPGLALEGFWTHLAVADEVADPYTAEQLARFEAVGALLGDAGCIRRCVTPPTRPVRCGTPAAASTWSAAASPFTGWPRRSAASGIPASATCARPCPCGPGCRT